MVAAVRVTAFGGRRSGYVQGDGLAFVLSHPWRKKRAMDGAPVVVPGLGRTKAGPSTHHPQTEENVWGPVRSG